MTNILTAPNRLIESMAIAIKGSTKEKPSSELSRLRIMIFTVL